LDISHKNLTGTLDLSDFTNLEKLKMSSNQLADISFLKQLPNPEKLRVLDLSSNNITSDLRPFSCFTNLEELSLGGIINVNIEVMLKNRDKLSEKSLNKFYGSLKPLKNLTKLKKLDISDTDIDKGLEYLSESVVEFCCLADTREESKVKILFDCFGSGKEEVTISQKKLQS